MIGQIENPYISGESILSCIVNLERAVPSLGNEPSPYFSGGGILAMRGLGKEIWQRINVEEYLTQLRQEWND